MLLTFFKVGALVELLFAGGGGDFHLHQRLLEIQPERDERVLNMVQVMEEHFGSCTMFGECEAVCPKEISIDFIARMNGDYIVAKFKNR